MLLLLTEIQLKLCHCQLSAFSDKQHTLYGNAEDPLFNMKHGETNVSTAFGYIYEHCAYCILHVWKSAMPSKVCTYGNFEVNIEHTAVTPYLSRTKKIMSQTKILCITFGMFLFYLYVICNHKFYVASEAPKQIYFSHSHFDSEMKCGNETTMFHHFVTKMIRLKSTAFY